MSAPEHDPKGPDESHERTVYKPKGPGVWVNAHLGHIELTHQLAANAFAEAKSYVVQAHNLLASAEGHSEEFRLQRVWAARGCLIRAVDRFRVALKLRG